MNTLSAHIYFKPETRIFLNNKLFVLQILADAIRYKKKKYINVRDRQYCYEKWYNYIFDNSMKLYYHKVFKY